MEATSSARSVAQLAVGAAVSSAITFLAAPILSRLFSPEVYGSWATIFAVAAFLSVVGCLRYEVTIPLQKSDRDAANIVACCLGCIVITGLTIALIVGASDLLVSKLLKGNAIEFRHWIAPIASLNALYLCCIMWATRRKNFRTSALSRVTSAGSQALGTIAFALAGVTSAFGLMFGFILGRVIGVGTLVIGGANENTDKFPAVSTRRAFGLMKDHWRFPLINIWTPILAQLSLQMPIFLLAATYNPYIVGLYAFGARIAELPTILMAQALGQVFYRRAAERHATGDLTALVHRFVVQLFFLAIPMFSVMMIVSPFLFAYAFGEQWREAGVFVSILAGVRLSIFVFSPINGLFNILGKHSISVAFNTLLLCSASVGLVVGSNLGPRYAVGGYSLVTMLVLQLMIIYLLCSSGVKIRQFLAEVMPCVITWMLITVIIIIGMYVMVGTALWSLTLLVVAIGLYGYWWWQKNSDIIAAVRSIR